MITKKLLREWGACWTDEQLAEKFGRRTAVTPREVAADASISLDDRMWVIGRCLWYLDESAARLFAVECAASVAHLAGDEDDQAQYLGLLNWLIEIEDLPIDQRDAARDAARAAAWDAARAAARAAAWAAARAAARDAARAAAWDAARAAAWDAARAAAWDAARAAAWDAHLQKMLDLALAWLGDHANGWEE